MQASDNKATSWQPEGLRLALSQLNQSVQGMRQNLGNLDDFGSGVGEGVRVTPEDRRDMLWAIRDREGKSEPPRATQTLTTQPSFDVLRQIKTIDPDGLGRLIPLAPFKDDAFMVRANAGMNFGPNPTEVEGIGRQLKPKYDPEKLAQYKRALKEQSILKKAGYLTGSAASDLVNDSSRAIWWLINAPQAIVNLGSETGAAVFNPDLFARREVGLDEALKEGMVTYKQPRISKEVIKERAEEISREDHTALLNKFASGLIDPENPYTFEDNERDLAILEETSKRKAIEQLEREAKENLANYRRAKPGVKILNNRILKNRFNPNLVNAAAIVPAALAINAGIGLTGRREGYQAVVPDEDDNTKTSNAIAEVASRYILGREGRLLEAEDFLLERPDVTYGEYQKYKGYLRDREIDWNPLDDGKINIGGILKTNPDGIRGAEVSFMGKSLPVNDTIIPTVSAVAGTALGAALTNLGSIRLKGGLRNRKGIGKLNALRPEVLPRDPKTAQRVYANAEPDSDGLKPKNTFINRMQAEFDKDDGYKNLKVLGTIAGSGLLGAAAGTAAGESIEDERRRRNFAERNPNIDYDLYKANALQLLEDQQRIKAMTPEQERGDSKVGFNKRSQQQALNTTALKQQTLIDQIVNEDLRHKLNVSKANSSGR